MFFAGSFDETKMKDVCSAKYQQVFFFYLINFFGGLETRGECPKFQQKNKKKRRAGGEAY